MVPASHRKPIDGVRIPARDAEAGDLWSALQGQTGQLDKSNGRHADDLETIEKCEARDRATVARLQAPWWKRPFLKAAP